MNEKREIVGKAEETSIGKRQLFLRLEIEGPFGDLLDLYGRSHQTPRDAFYNSLFGKYELDMDKRTHLYVLTCQGKQPDYVEP
jgi:hypothetical protein